MENEKYAKGTHVFLIFLCREIDNANGYLFFTLLWNGRWHLLPVSSDHYNVNNSLDQAYA